MHIKEFKFEPVLIDKFVRFEYDLYRGDDNWIPPLKVEMYSQLSPHFPFYAKPGNSHRHFIAIDGNKVLGRISVMINADLKDRDGTPVGTVGFFECIDDFTVASTLLDSGADWLKDRDIKRIWGPMNFDIWHSYRFMTAGFDQNLFYGEPYNKTYYPRFFERYGFAVRDSWDSLEITGRDRLREMTVRGKQRYKLLTDKGYRFELIDTENLDAELTKLHSVMSKSFSGFLGFTPIALNELKDLFTKSIYALHPRLFIFAYDETGTLAGFAGAFVELADAIRSMNGKSNPVAKLKFLYRRRQSGRINFYIGGITPEAATRRSGLGRAGFYYIINQMLEEGYETLLLTLRLKGNSAHALVGKNAPTPQREYALYELNI